VGTLPADLVRLRRVNLPIVDGWLHPLRARRHNLFFQLVFSRQEHASIILTSNLPFSR